MFLVSYVDPLVSAALRSAQWLFVQVENYQVKFHLTEANLLKYIFKTSQPRATLYVMR